MLDSCEYMVDPENKSNQQETIVFKNYNEVLQIIIVAASVFALVACSTSKEISYFQDLRPGESELMLAVPMEIKIQPKDKLSILVNSQDLRLTNLFNLPIVSQQVGQDSSLGTNRGLSGYTVDSKGDIDFPVLGKLHVQDMTREEVAVYIKRSYNRTTSSRIP